MIAGSVMEHISKKFQACARWCPCCCFKLWKLLTKRRRCNCATVSLDTFVVLLTFLLTTFWLAILFIKSTTWTFTMTTAANEWWRQVNLVNNHCSVRENSRNRGSRDSRDFFHLPWFLTIAVILQHGRTFSHRGHKFTTHKLSTGCLLFTCFALFSSVIDPGFLLLWLN